MKQRDEHIVELNANLTESLAASARRNANQLIIITGLRNDNGVLEGRIVNQGEVILGLRELLKDYRDSSDVKLVKYDAFLKALRGLDSIPIEEQIDFLP
jgi:hypothetical protein